MIREFSRTDGGMTSSIVRVHFGKCPAGCYDGNSLPGDAVVYRSSWRSVTLRCCACGLLWTMTVHQMAKAARAHADRMSDSPHTNIRAVYERDARWLGEWAQEIDDRRGRIAPGVS
jgi:hypothetical protein